MINESNNSAVAEAIDERPTAQPIADTPRAA
jgi:hypothetical protein